MKWGYRWAGASGGLVVVGPGRGLYRCDAIDRVRSTYLPWSVDSDNHVVVAPALEAIPISNGSADMPDLMLTQNQVAVASLALEAIPISNGSTVLPELMPSHNQAGSVVVGPGSLEAILPYSSSEQAHLKLLPWLRHPFRRNWESSRPKPKNSPGD